MQLPLQAQRDRWLLYPTEYTPGSGSGVTYSWNLSLPYVAENFIYAGENRPLFYVNNQGYYDRFGNNLGSLIAPYAMLKEIEIVPVPGSCDVYCVLYLAAAPLVTLQLALEEVTIGINGVPSVTAQSWYPNATRPTNFAGNLGGLAVSPILSGTDGDRHVWMVSSANVHLLQMTNQGVIEQTTSVWPTVIPQYLQPSGSMSEVDLSPTQEHLLWGADDQLVLFNVSNQTFAAISANDEIVGVEFSADGDAIYYCVRGEGVYRTNTLLDQSIFISGVISDSQLELGADGNIYGVDSEGKLSYIKSDDSVIPTSQSVYSNAASFGTNYYALPQQVDGESEALLQPIVPPQLSDPIINGVALPATPAGAPDFFDCLPMLFNFTVDANATDFEITVAEVNPTTGLPNGGLLYTTTLAVLGGLPVDLRCLDDPLNCDLFGAVPGDAYRVTVTAINGSNEDCPESSAPLVGYFSVSASPKPATVSLLMYKGTFGDPGCFTQQINNACPVGNVGLSFDLSNSSGVITFVEVNIDEVDCTTGALIGSLYDGPVITTSGVSTFQNINLNGLIINGGDSYFAENPGLVNGRCFRFEATVGNVCGQSTTFSYFFVDPSLPRPPGIVPWVDTNGFLPSDWQLYPNPVRDQLQLRLPASFGGGEVHVLAPDGRQLDRRRLVAGETAAEVSVATLPSGLYYLRLLDERSGQVSIQSFVHE